MHLLVSGQHRDCTLYLIGCNESRSVCFWLILSTCIPMQPFTQEFVLEFASWTSVQFVCCAQALSCSDNLTDSQLSDVVPASALNSSSICKACNALCTLVGQENKNFQITVKMVVGNVAYLHTEDVS